MNYRKKIKVANTISFILFGLYILTYILLPIIEKNVYYLFLLIFPVIFLITVIIKELGNRNRIKLHNIEKVSKVASILNILFNGISLNTITNFLSTSTRNWDNVREDIKKYPSITPIWVFLLFFTTIFVNGISLFFAYDKSLNIFFSVPKIIIVTIISIIFILLTYISSTVALYHNNGKREVFRQWKVVIAINISLILIAIYSVYKNDKSIIGSEIKKHRDREIFEQHKRNIEKALNNN